MPVAAIGLLAASLLIALFGAWSLVEARRIRRDSDRNLERELARSSGERQAMLDRIMHLSGNTWTLPPALLSETRQQPPEEQGTPVRGDVENFFAATYVPAEAELVSSNGAGAVL